MNRVLISKIVTAKTLKIDNLNEEWVELQNTFGPLNHRGWVVWEIETSSGLWRRYYSFPDLTSVKGDVLRIHTGGNPKYGGSLTKSNSDPAVIHLYANRRQSVWTDPRNRICVANNLYDIEDIKNIESILVKASS